MLPWLILGVCLIVGLWLIGRWYVNAQPADILRVLRWVGAVVLAAGLILIVLMGRWNLLWMLAFPAIPLLGRLRALAAMRRNAQGPRPGQSSQVETRFLRMTLDHDSGDMDGEVREGAFAGQTLSRMSLGDLIALWRTCAQEDEASRTVLETFLDRHQPDWRDVAGVGRAEDGGASGAGRESPWNRDGMTLSEAREILGVEPGATEEEIEAAWRREMKRAHPDQGGSDWMAAKVNQAKYVLLKR
jgi:DnaJ-domain-containing protein 1